MKSNISQMDFSATPRKKAGRAGKVGAAKDSKPGFQPDYTQEIIAFLQSVHGNTRVDERGDYYYGKVSTISLHFLLSSELPAKELLWGWYDYFDRERSETIYQTLPPFQDEAFLRILEGCAFSWNPETVRASGWVFSSRHRKKIYLALEEFLVRRLESHRNLEEAELKKWLTPHNTWSEVHLRRQIRQLQTRPLGREERQNIYERLETGYLRATARQLMDEAAGEAFWKSPPPELEPLRTRFKVLATTLRDASLRLGVYVTQDAYKASHWREQGRNHQRGRRRTAGDRREYQRGQQPQTSRISPVEHFRTLGLPPTAKLEEVKAAYREKVKEYHPDQGGTVPEFLRLQEAYEFLLTQVF